MQENKVVKMECIDLNHDGLGVCRYDDKVVFVEDMLIGEEAFVCIYKEEKSFSRGYVKQMIKSSKDRVKPICPQYYYCGGCHLMHLDYQSQLNFKRKMVEETIKRIGHVDVEVKEIIGMDNPYYYRNKVQIPFGMNKDQKVICGFYKQKSNDIIPLDRCFIEPELATDIVKFIKNVCNELKITAYDKFNKQGSLRHVLIRNNNANEYMVVLITRVENIDKLSILVDKIHARYPQVKSIIQNINSADNNVILGAKAKCLYGEETLIENLCGLKFKMSHNSFFQTNHVQTERLYNKVLEFLNPQPNETIIDAYCGVGTISLLIAQKAKKVYGIEIVQEAIENAKENAKINKINNVEFIAGKSEEEIKKLSDIKIDAIVVDPPRKGCDKILLETIMEKNIEKMVYVSCDVATLARDVDILSLKYDLKKVVAVDLFPQTNHVETIVLLEAKQTKK